MTPKARAQARVILALQELDDGWYFHRHGDALCDHLSAALDLLEVQADRIARLEDIILEETGAVPS